MQKLTQRLKSQEGFTLMEVIVVVAILAILAAILTPKLLDTLNESRKKSTISTAKQIQVGLERYSMEVGKYPVDQTATGVAACDPTATKLVECAVTDYASLRGAVTKFVNMPVEADAKFGYGSYAVSGGSYTLGLTVESTGDTVTVTPDTVK